MYRNYGDKLEELEGVGPVAKLQAGFGSSYERGITVRNLQYVAITVWKRPMKDVLRVLYFDKNNFLVSEKFSVKSVDSGDVVTKDGHHITNIYLKYDGYYHVHLPAYVDGIKVNPRYIAKAVESLHNVFSHSSKRIFINALIHRYNCIGENSGVWDWEAYAVYVNNRVQSDRKECTYDKRFPFITDREVHKFVLGIEKAYIRRYEDQDDCDYSTYTAASITISIPTEHTRPDRNSFIQEHMKEFVKIAMYVLLHDTEFKKYKPNISELALKRVYLNPQSQLVFCFERQVVCEQI